MEQIYTIPVREAFSASAENRTCGCPMCALYRKLENEELDRILGAAMMEPDVRIETNREGFCRTHYDAMLLRKNRLGMALTLESHLQELQRDLREGTLAALTGHPESRPVKRITALESSCYVCRRVAFHFAHMAQTVILLYETDGDFAALLEKQPYFCLPHYRLLLENGAARLGKKRLPEFVKTLSDIEQSYLSELNGDVSWFCKKFDYRYGAEPWKNAKDSVERAIAFLRSDLHRTDD